MIYAGIGSRETPANILEAMRYFAAEAAHLGWTLRSGGADGADSAFEFGAGTQKEIWVPWYNYNGRRSTHVCTRAAIELAEQFHPAWDRCSQGARKLHGRNMHILLGENFKSPVDFVLCWTKDGGPTGGTGQAIRAAGKHTIPVYNLFHTDALDRAKEALHARTSIHSGASRREHNHVKGSRGTQSSGSRSATRTGGLALGDFTLSA
jgi:hypothetical protein